MNIAGLDLSLTGTGFAGFYGEWVIAFPKRRGIERIVAIRDEVVRNCCAVFEDPADPADLVVIEDYAFSRAASHAHELGELGGVVKVALRELGIPTVLVSPSALKKFATGKGNADKTAMAVAASKRAGKEFANDNECDAWWLRQLGLYAYGDESLGLPAAQCEVAGALSWPAMGSLA